MFIPVALAGGGDFFVSQGLLKSSRRARQIHIQNESHRPKRGPRYVIAVLSFLGSLPDVKEIQKGAFCIKV